MCTDDNDVTEVALNHKLIGRLCELDDNLLSFLCGIFSNVPVSLCLLFTKCGDKTIENIYFALILFSIIISVISVVFIFQFTLRKMKYISPNTAHKGPDEVVDAINEALDEWMPKDKNEKQVKKYTYLKKPVVCFFICIGILLCTIIALWVLANFIK